MSVIPLCESYGLHPFMIHRPNFIPESNDDRKFVVEVFIRSIRSSQRLPQLQILQQLALPLNSVRILSGASALVSMRISTGSFPFLRQPTASSTQPSVHSLRNFTTSTFSRSGSLGDYYRGLVASQRQPRLL